MRLDLTRAAAALKFMALVFPADSVDKLLSGYLAGAAYDLQQLEETKGDTQEQSAARAKYWKDAYQELAARTTTKAVDEVADRAIRAENELIRTQELLKLERLACKGLRDTMGQYEFEAAEARLRCDELEKDLEEVNKQLAYWKVSSADNRATKLDLCDRLDRAREDSRLLVQERLAERGRRMAAEKALEDCQTELAAAQAELAAAGAMADAAIDAKAQQLDYDTELKELLALQDAGYDQGSGLMVVAPEV